MEGVNFSSSVSAPRQASHHDELFMQQRSLFSDSLKELKNLRKQLYSAAEYFEMSYSKEDQKEIVVETLKDYAFKAFISTVDHLGTVAYKVNGFLDEKISEISGTELRVSCIDQRLQTCRHFIDYGGLFQQSLSLNFPKHHKRYIFPARATINVVGQSKSTYSNAENDSRPFKSAVQATTSKSFPTMVRKEHSALHSRSSARPGTFQFTRINSNRALENQAVSPNRFPFIRSGSLVKRPTAINSSTAKQQYPSEPRRSISLSTRAERDRAKELVKYSDKSKQFLKALLSMNKSKRNGML